MSRRLPALLITLLLVGALTSGCFQQVSMPSTPYFEQGVSWELAEQRSQTLSNIRYTLALDIPEVLTDAISGEITFSFSLKDSERPLLIDFNQPISSVHALEVNGNAVPIHMVFNHIVLEGLPAGDHTVRIAFTAGDASLNRNPGFLYTLFVPDRASFSIPLFDQPNLKARYTLQLKLPESWKGVANGPEVERTPPEEGYYTISFAETEPLPTYLFAFAAGEFETISQDRSGRSMTLYHRETDAEKVERNVDAVFELHETALNWLEDYTQIPYPFQKFDFVLIPSFQYGGMEHPGSILYRASSLFLEETATQNQMLGRASLIAHETAHMWFGDLVTMDWFDDVWTKEVFANFMAAKMVNPSFPDIDHDLRFLLRHYPAAYEVDRTEGANAIRQPLENLQQAGTLYGSIIYQKAPIVMRMLEGMVGEASFREGMQEYLTTFAFGNATWPDLIAILDTYTEQDLASWSRTWVEEAGRPVHEVTLVEGAPEGSLTVVQSDPFDRGRFWPQNLEVWAGENETRYNVPVTLQSSVSHVELQTSSPDFVIPNGGGQGYGLFLPDSATTAHLLTALPGLEPAQLRATGWITLWDAMLEEQIAPQDLLQALKAALPLEPDELIKQRILSDLRALYWQYLKGPQRDLEAFDLERLFLSGLKESPSLSLKSSYFNAFLDVALTEQATDTLFATWEQASPFHGLQLSEQDYTRMALELAVRMESEATDILDAQQQRLTNPDRRARYAFVRQALSPIQEERDAFFALLAEPDNRRQEPWVLEALRYLHHPLRVSASEKYLSESLQLLEEIQQTGDIFFPKRWLDTTLRFYQAPSAAQTVRSFLDANPGYPHRLKGKLIQSADPLFRASRILYSDEAQGSL